MLSPCRRVVSSSRYQLFYPLPPSLHLPAALTRYEPERFVDCAAFEIPALAYLVGVVNMAPPRPKREVIQGHGIIEFSGEVEAGHCFPHLRKASIIPSSGTIWSEYSPVVAWEANLIPHQ